MELDHGQSCHVTPVGFRHKQYVCPTQYSWDQETTQQKHRIGYKLVVVGLDSGFGFMILNTDPSSLLPYFQKISPVKVDQAIHIFTMPRDPSPWRFGISPGKGMGMFARRNLKAGEAVFTEAALIATTDSSPIQICRQVCDLNQHGKSEYRFLRHSAPEDILAKYLISLCEDNKDHATGEPIVHQLHVARGSKDVAIFWNNCFTYRHRSTDTVDTQGVFAHSARLNHSCNPNCYVSWNEALDQGKLCTRAIRDIYEDEELLICYDENELLLESLQARTRSLKEKYGFDCDCEACYVPVTPWTIVPTKRDAIANVMAEINTYPVIGDNAASLEPLYNELLDSMEHIGLKTWKYGRL